MKPETPDACVQRRTWTYHAMDADRLLAVLRDSQCQEEDHTEMPAVSAGRPKTPVPGLNILVSFLMAALSVLVVGMLLLMLCGLAFASWVTPHRFGGRSHPGESARRGRDEQPPRKKAA